MHSRLGSELSYSPESVFPFMAGGRYRAAFRMGGVRAGKKLGEQLMGAGVARDEAVKRIIDLLEHCKVGNVKVNKTIGIRDSCESNVIVKFYATRWEEPCCFYTTGFLNGFFSAVKNQHVRETRCIAMGDPYCEWEFR